MSAIRYDGVETVEDKSLANIAKISTKTLPLPLLQILGSFLFHTEVMYNMPQIKLGSTLRLLKRSFSARVTTSKDPLCTS